MLRSLTTPRRLDIRVEENLEGGEESGVIPDITFTDKDGDKVCVEVETLIGTGEPMKKIDESVEKYRGLGALAVRSGLSYPPKRLSST